MNETNPNAYTQPAELRAAPNRQKFSLDLKNAKPEEMQFFFNILDKQIRVDLGFYLQLILALILTVFGLVLHNDLLGFSAALISPFFSTFLGMNLAIAIGSLRKFGLSLFHLLVSLIAFYFSGHFAALVSHASAGTDLLKFLNANSYLSWGLLIISAILLGIFFIRQREEKRLASAMLSLLICLPLARLGWQNQTGGFESGGLILCGLKVFLALFCLAMVFWFSRLLPRSWKGWAGMMFILLGLISFAFSAATAKFSFGQETISPELTTPISPLNNRPTEVIVTIVPSNTPTVPPPPTETPLPTFTPTPTPVKGMTVAQSGIYLRKEASTASEILGFLEYGTKVTLTGEKASGSDYEWVQVTTTDGISGWLLADFVSTED